jgi:hypothetical protein
MTLNVPFPLVFLLDLVVIGSDNVMFIEIHTYTAIIASGESQFTYMLGFYYQGGCFSR